MTEERESIKVLQECIDLQVQKSRDYQNDVSSVKQADYYRLGVDSIYDMMHTKMLRLKSLMETAKADPYSTPKFESLKDTAKDLINYTSFFAAYLDGKVDGQDPNNDMFNRPKTNVSESPLVDAAVSAIESPTSWIDTQIKQLAEHSTNIILPIQINGKLVTRLSFPKEFSAEDIEELVLNYPKVKDIIKDDAVKIIIVPHRLVNILHEAR